MTCSNCHASIHQPARFCASCGTAVIGAEAGSAVDPLLAAANLLRIRRQWPEAEARCIEAMQADPQSATAHALLGEIYREQGRLTESAQWFQLALELNPASEPDRIKLAEVEREIARLGAARPAGDASPYGTQKLMGIVSPQHLLRALTAVSVVFLVLITALLLAAQANRRQTAHRTRAAQAATVQYGAPAPVQPGLSEAPARAQVPAAPTMPAPAPQRRQAKDPAPLRGYTERETALRTELAKAFGAGEVAVEAVTVDAAERRANLVVSYTGSKAGEALRPELPTLALLAARTALNVDPNLARVSVNVRADLGEGRVEPAFGGDIERAAMGSASESQGFAWSWWAPSLAPQGEAGPAPSRQPEPRIE